MDIEDIKDGDSLEEWLNALPKDQKRSTSLFIASRAALRVLPLVLEDESFWPENGELTALPVLWAVSISEVAALTPTSEIAFAASRAANAADAVAYAADAVAVA
ncbi:MAG: hypothetical protein AAFR53_17500, partial [Pseudomonadota bacterium]